MSTTVLGVIAIIGMLLVGISLLLADIYQKVKELNQSVRSLSNNMDNKYSYLSHDLNHLFGEDFNKGFKLGLQLEYRKGEDTTIDGDYRIEC